MAVGAIAMERRQQPPSKRIVYVDTEANVDPGRVRDLAHAVQCDYDTIATQLVVLRNIDSRAELMTTLDALEYDAIEHGLDLIVVDSMATLVRSAGVERQWERECFYADVGMVLKRLSSLLNIPIVLINHAVDLPSAHSHHYHGPGATSVSVTSDGEAVVALSMHAASACAFSSRVNYTPRLKTDVADFSLQQQKIEERGASTGATQLASLARTSCGLWLGSPDTIPTMDVSWQVCVLLYCAFVST